MRVVSKLITVTLVACGAASAAHAKKEPIVIEPSSKWHVDFAPNKCRLARTFGEDANRHLLFFEQFSPEKTVGLTVSGPSFDRFKTRQKTGLRFFEAQEAFETEPFKGDLDSVGPAMIYSTVDLEKGDDIEDGELTSLPQLDAALGEKVEFVALQQRGREVQLRSGPLGEAFKVLNQCTQSLLSDWGLDAEKHLAARQLPKWKNERRVAGRIARVYPRSALNRGEQSILRMRVIVNEKGEVSECAINEATTTEKLESPACKEMLKAEFSPAIDSKGQPFKSYYATSIIYEIDR